MLRHLQVPECSDMLNRMVWEWLLRYSSHLLTGIISFLVALLVHRITSRTSELIYYVSQQQWVSLLVPGAAGAPPNRINVGTFTLFLQNLGKAPARDVYVGHFFLPSQSVFPDIPRSEQPLPGGGRAIVFPVIPPKTLISITYLLNNPLPIEQIVAYVGSEAGHAAHIPVILQRLFPKPVLWLVWVIMFLGTWVLVNFVISLIEFLAAVYYFR